MASQLVQEGALNNVSLRTIILALQKVLNEFVHSTGGLAIKAGGSVLAKTVNTIKFSIDGSVYTKAAADCAALSGTVTNAAFNVFCFYVDAAGAFTTLMGTEGASLGAVVFPDTVTGTAMVGYVVINPTGTGNFVGGTTDLDDATVAPNAAYINTPYPIGLGKTVDLSLSS